MDLMKSLKIAASGLGAQSHRMRIISENIANTDSISNIKGGDPYQRKLSTFKQVYDHEIGAELKYGADFVTSSRRFNMLRSSSARCSGH